MLSDFAYVVTSGLCWPKPAQQVLLDVFAHADPAAARASFQTWRASNPLEDLDLGSLALMPLLFVRLKDLGVADPCLARLKGTYRHHFCRNQLQLRQAIEATDVLGARGIPVLALKGWALLDYYGGDVALRPMSDVDMLVPRDRAREAIDQLVGRGWRIEGRREPVDWVEAMGKCHGIGLRRGSTELDVHWASLIEDNVDGADAGLWIRSEARSMAGREVRVPSPTDLLFHGCVHGARWSQRSSIVWVIDALKILEREKNRIDWRRLVDDARARYLEIPLRETLLFLATRMNVALPPGVLGDLEPPEPASLLWLDYYAHSADPRRCTSAHRSASIIVGKLRQGLAVSGVALAPCVRPFTSLPSRVS